MKGIAMHVREGQTWEDRGARVVVERVMEGGGAVVRDKNGLRHPVQASYFLRARLISDAPRKERNS